MSAPSQKKSSSVGPSIRLNLAGSASRSSTPTPAAPTANNKKRRFHPPVSNPNMANAHDLNLLHQTTQLSFVLQKEGLLTSTQWKGMGVTSLYVTEESAETTTENMLLSLGLHFRGTHQIQSVTIDSLGKDGALSRWKKCVYHHLDPLQTVLLKPAATFTADDGASSRYEADSQCSRGATGMTSALRAASMASNLGELRISAQVPAATTAKPETIQKLWKEDLMGRQQQGGTDPVTHRLDKRLESRLGSRQQDRLDFIAKELANRSTQQKALKITVRYEFLWNDNGNETHMGGIHALTQGVAPHVYTTSGVYGDHEGPRCWVPTLDSASTRHRSSHEITIRVTAPMTEGISVLGMGEDFGASETLLHDPLSNCTDVQKQAIRQELGGLHHSLLTEEPDRSQPNVMREDAHLIPPEQDFPVANVSVLATCVWKSYSWMPIPARSLGFAIGPFRILEDPEYFSLSSDVTRNDIHVARQNGEGIQQAYFSPLFARRKIHCDANQVLLPNSNVVSKPLTVRQRDILKGVDQSILASSVGVPHRALSLMRDVLALPAFRTVSYTQIWIPSAVHGGSTSGALHCCPEVLVNPFLGGAIMNSRILPPIGHRLPFHQGGRVIQFLQARSAIRGWIVSAIPLGGRDDVGQGFIHTVFESLLMSLYEKGHGAHGEGGGKGGYFYTNRFSPTSGLNSSNLDYLPIQNIELSDFDMAMGGVAGAIPLEDRNNDQLWRSPKNGTESHSSAMDEHLVRHLLTMDSVNTLERGTDKDRHVPTPSMGWMGSHLSLSFLSSNATSSSDVGCGAMEMMHPTGGLVYRALKGNVFRKVVEGRAGMTNFIRLVRAAFIAAHLGDKGQKELLYPTEKKSSNAETPSPTKGKPNDESGKEAQMAQKPRFIVCVNEILKKQGLTLTLFSRALQNLAGKIRESQLLGTLVDVDRDSKDPRSNRSLVDPEGFPNSYVRGASRLYLRVGLYVEPARDSNTGASKGVQLHSYAEQVIPEGGISFGGPITVRVVENEGQLREFVKELGTDGSRIDWGSVFLHAKPVTLPKAQTASSGSIERSSNDDDKTAKAKEATVDLAGRAHSEDAFTKNNLHRDGYQAIELIRLTNLTPLLWVRVDPMGVFGGRISVFQPDASLAEMLFHDGDAGAQVDAMRALSERPLRIQGSVKVTTVYDVNVAELPVRVLGDCLRGSSTLHSSLPHTPAVRVQAALAICQWQNNKAPASKNQTGTTNWVGFELLVQYFRERFYNNGIVTPLKFGRVVLKKDGVHSDKGATNEDSAAPGAKTSDTAYQYLDSFQEGIERAVALEEADEVETEEDEEYRVRSAVVISIACIRAKDGMTPTPVIAFLETILETVDAEMLGNFVSPDEETILAETTGRGGPTALDEPNGSGFENGVEQSVPYVSSMLVADTLLALCHVNSSPAQITDPATGKLVQVKGNHPVTKLLEAARRWLDWDLYRSRIRSEIESTSLSGVSGDCYDPIAASAITAMYSLAILRQCTTEDIRKSTQGGDDIASKTLKRCEEAATAEFYKKMFVSSPLYPDITRAACAQAVACISCAADRFQNEDSKQPLGLLTAMEFLLEGITNQATSPGLRQTLAQLMLDACTGKVCSVQRVGAVGGRNDLVLTASRLLNGPLASAYGGDNGSATLSAVNPISFPAANAVNDGARRGLKLLSRAGHPRESGVGQEVVTRVAIFATKLWRTLNGELSVHSSGVKSHGVCAYDGHLRCALLALWQWVWPRGCFAVMQVQTWKAHEGTESYKKMGADKVMKVSSEEKAATEAEETALVELNRIVTMEIDRQKWRGEMATKSYDFFRMDLQAGNAPDVSSSEQGIGQPLPPIQRDSAFKAGGWISSSAQQRRDKGLDGGSAVTKLRLRKSGD